MLPPTITIPTNYNNKLGCDRFIHIQVAPKYRIPESVASSSPIIIYTADHSHPPVTVTIFDAVRVPFKHLPCSWVSLSHGIDLDRFQEIVMGSAQNIGPDTEMAVFFYQKTEQQ